MQEKQINGKPTLTLLFVHLGTKIPGYLQTNIERSRVMFPGMKISLVTDSKNAGSWALKYDIEVMSYQRDDYFNSAFTFGKLETNFRNGYWRYTIERLAAIKTFHELHPTTPVLHIESDVILMPNFPTDQVSKLDKMHWLNYGIGADIAAMIYSPSAGKTTLFYQHLIEEIKLSGGSDMEILWKLRTKYKKIYSTFPTINSKTKSLQNTIDNEVDFDVYEIAPESIFEGVFDAAGIGIWLFGGDPNNNFGFTTIHTRELIDTGNIFIDSSKATFVGGENGELCIETAHHGLVPVYNLHIHSKNRKLLSIEWKPELVKLLEITDKSSKVTGFNIKILIEAIYQNLRKKSLLRYIMHIPILKKLKRLLKP